MKKQIREIQPAHKGSTITVGQAVRAFRQVRGDGVKPDIFDDTDRVVVECGPGRRRMVVTRDDETARIAADTAQAVPRTRPG